MSDDSFKRFMDEILHNAKGFMKVGIPALGVPPLDPLDIGKLRFGEDTSYVNFKAYFYDVIVCGLSEITFNKVTYDPKTLEVSTKAMVPALEAKGKYRLTGTALFVIPLQGNGDITVKAEAVSVDIAMTLDANRDMKKTKVEIKDIGFQYGSVKVNLSGLEGGGELGKDLNAIINGIGGRLLHHLEPIITGAIEHSLQAVLNNELSKMPDVPVLDAAACSPDCDAPLAKAFYRPKFDLVAEKKEKGNLDGLFDKILANVNNELSHSYDPWRVDKGASTSFSKGISMPWPIPDIKVHGGAKFNNIEIFGFSHLIRTGPVTLSPSPPTISFSIGTSSSIHGGGDWSAWLHPVSVSGTGSISVSNTDIVGVIQIINRKGKIQTIGFGSNPNVSVDISGLGPLSYITSQLVDAVTGVVSPWLNEIMMPTVKGVLQDQLDKFELPF